MEVFSIGYVNISHNALKDLQDLLCNDDLMADLSNACKVDIDETCEIEVEASADTIWFLHSNGYLLDNELSKAKDCDYIKFFSN